MTSLEIGECVIQTKFHKKQQLSVKEDPSLSLLGVQPTQEVLKMGTHLTKLTPSKSPLVNVLFAHRPQMWAVVVQDCRYQKCRGVDRKEGANDSF